MSAALATRVWVTYIVHAQREGERYPWRKCARTQTIEVQQEDIDAAFSLGSRALGAELVDSRTRRSRGGRKP